MARGAAGRANTGLCTASRFLIFSLPLPCLGSMHQIALTNSQIVSPESRLICRETDHKQHMHGGVFRISGQKREHLRSKSIT